MSKCFDSIFSKYQFGFRNGYNVQQCLLTMIEKWRACLDQKGTCAVLFTGLSKTTDCLPHDLLIAKIHVYGCDLLALKLHLRNLYLRNRH